MVAQLYPVCIGSSRTSKKWRNQDFRWGDLIQKLSTTKRTGETLDEYMSMTRDRQAEIKDVGGIVCGSLKEDNGRKTKDNIRWRSIITLDIDDCPEGYDPTVVIGERLPGIEALAHTTHKHTPEHPRWRVYIPLSDPMTPFYYEAIARQLGSLIGMDNLDKSTFQPNRLMYWPSTSSDGQYLFKRKEGHPVSTRKFFEVFPHLKRESQWPRHPQEEQVTPQSVMTEREGVYSNDRKPLTTVEKTGIVGAFMRAYAIDEAIDVFLSDVYKPAGLGRYTYLGGSSEGGLVIYDGMFAYSNHATDPANNGHDNNAFDLVRIHKFGYLDSQASKTTRADRLPSYQAMVDFAREDRRVKVVIAALRKAESEEDFSDIDPLKDDEDWRVDLEVNKSGGYVDSNRNQDIIMMNDEVFKTIRYDEFRRINIIGNPSLLDCSSSRIGDEHLRNIATRYEQKYSLRLSVNRIVEILSGTQSRRGFNPVHDFIRKEEWDGVERVDTLLVRCLGAEDNDLVRAQTRAWMIGAVKRAFEPGCKFDYMLVLTGPQGIGKSTFLWAIAGEGEFLNESLQLDMATKDLIEQLNNGWIFEIAELGGLRTAKDTDKIKALITKVSDTMRKAYGHEVEDYPRHCALAASTNDTSFFIDPDSRKFWVVKVAGMGNMEWLAWLHNNLHQVWAEAYTYYKQGQNVFLSMEMEQKAREVQKSYNVVNEDPLTAVIAAYLDYNLKDSWRKLNKRERREFIENYNSEDDLNTLRRNKICAAEIFNEVYEARGKYSARWINKNVMPAIGWKLMGDGKRVYIDKQYGNQRNVFCRPGTDGKDSYGKGNPNLTDNEDDEDL